MDRLTGMSRSSWSVVVAALFAIVLQWTPLPAQARATLILLAWVALALSCIGWLLAHTGWGQRLRSHRKATRPMVLLFVFMVGGILTVATWLLVPKLTAEQSPLAQDAKAPLPMPTATPSPLSPPPTATPQPPQAETASNNSVPPTNKPRRQRPRRKTSPNDTEDILYGRKKGPTVN